MDIDAQTNTISSIVYKTGIELLLTSVNKSDVWLLRTVGWLGNLKYQLETSMVGCAASTESRSLQRPGTAEELAPHIDVNLTWGGEIRGGER